MDAALRGESGVTGQDDDANDELRVIEFPTHPVAANRSTSISRGLRTCCPGSARRRAPRSTSSTESGGAA